MAELQISNIDLAVIVGYVLGMLGIGYVIYRKAATLSAPPSAARCPWLAMSQARRRTERGSVGERLGPFHLDQRAGARSERFGDLRILPAERAPGSTATGAQRR